LTWELTFPWEQIWEQNAITALLTIDWKVASGGLVDQGVDQARSVGLYLFGRTEVLMEQTTPRHIY
jgi:hypothetical protein